MILSTALYVKPRELVDWAQRGRLPLSVVLHETDSLSIRPHSPPNKHVTNLIPQP